jgi:sterol O-acyltransferase
MIFLGGVIAWAFFREWPWPQTVFILLHCIVLLMKQHSYAFYTGWLSNTYLRRERLQKELEELMDESNTTLSKINSLAEERVRLIREIETMDRELTGPVSGQISYPHNLTFANFADYMLCPTLIYELEYPRVAKYIPTHTN